MKRTGNSPRDDWTEMVEDKTRLCAHETFYTVVDCLKWARAHPELAPNDWPDGYAAKYHFFN